MEAELRTTPISEARRALLSEVASASASQVDVVSDVRDHGIARLMGGAPISAARVLFGPRRVEVQAFGFMAGQRDEATARLRSSTRIYLPAPATSCELARPNLVPSDVVVEFDLEGSIEDLVVAPCDISRSLCENWRRIRERMERVTPTGATRADTVIVPTFQLSAAATRRLQVDLAARRDCSKSAFILADLGLALASGMQVSQPRSVGDMMGARRAVVVFDSPFVVALVGSRTKDPRMIAVVRTPASLTPVSRRMLSWEELRPIAGRWVVDSEATVERAVRHELASLESSGEATDAGAAGVEARTTWARTRASRLLAEVDISMTIDEASDAHLVVRRRTGGRMPAGAETREEFRLEWDTDSIRLRSRPDSPTAVGDPADVTRTGIVALESGRLVVSPSIGLVDNPVFRREAP